MTRPFTARMAAAALLTALATSTAQAANEVKVTPLGGQDGETTQFVRCDVTFVVETQEEVANQIVP